MISEKYGFLFVHAGKGAGNSINAALLPYAEDVKTVDRSFQDGVQRFGLSNGRYGTTKHSRLSDYKARLPQPLFDRLYKFAVIRNPFDRLVSAYFSPHRAAQGLDPTFNHGEFRKVIQSAQVLREFICVSSGSHLSDDVDTLLSFERIEDDFAGLCRRLGLGDVSLPWINSSARGNYRDYYTQELRNLVSSKFAEEIEFGRYSF